MTIRVWVVSIKNWTLVTVSACGGSPWCLCWVWSELQLDVVDWSEEVLCIDIVVQLDLQTV